MASSNRHWPSMFKSKPTFSTHQDHQWHSHSSATHRSSPYSSGCEERTPEPKPRWNPKPEQIRILESIFNSGLVNPPRDEIKRIRVRLQEYGQVGDANVFYWFQNRKSRSKHKNRHLAKSQNNQTQTKATTTSSSSSSDKSSAKSIDFLLNSPTISVNQQPQIYLGGGTSGGYQPHHHLPHHQHHGEFEKEPYYFPVVQQTPTTTSFTQGFSFSELGSMITQDNQTVASSGSGMLLTDLMMNHQYGIPTNKSSKSKEIIEEDNLMKMLSSNTTTPSLATSSFTPSQQFTTSTTTIVPSSINDIQGVEEISATRNSKSIVFINDVPFEVAVGPFNVKDAFGADAVLIDTSGQSVVMNEWGETVESLQHGAFYYLVRSSFTYDHAAATVGLTLRGSFPSVVPLTRKKKKKKKNKMIMDFLKQHDKKSLKRDADFVIRLEEKKAKFSRQALASGEPPAGSSVSLDPMNVAQLQRMMETLVQEEPTGDDDDDFEKYASPPPLTQEEKEVERLLGLKSLVNHTWARINHINGWGDGNSAKGSKRESMGS
ncbi:WUSCHEL-related homeobox 9-like [Rutidosis leptorrhynchoides]|uniref:WUSCHEL-related homeobox 9-like n=1 Tax=Rutidosis leptorrhynchoides TaxID=125765 RepID=UPI003A9A644B